MNTLTYVNSTNKGIAETDISTQHMSENSENKQDQQNNSMEELRMEENDDSQEITKEAEPVKNTSAEEDFLGKQSLLMSDSEEETEHNPNDEFSDITKLIVNSEEVDEQAELFSEGKLCLAPTRRKNRIESDSEDETTNKTAMISAIIDSESDGNSDKRNDRKKKNNVSGYIRGLVVTDSDSETEAVKAKCRGLGKDADKDDKKQLKYKISALVDSDTDSELSQNGEIGDMQNSGNENETNSGQSRKPLKPMRASAKKALDEMQLIQSEQQRLHREAHISIPYHKPKLHTLQEFLKRRTIQKPQVKSEDSPGVALRQLKMNAEELEEYAKLMEERAKEATEFFKSESEDEELKQNGYTIATTEPKHNNQQLDSDSKNNSKTLPLDSDVDVDSAKALSKKETEEVLTSQPIVTEVIELPKLNINTLKIAPPTNTENIIRLIHMKQLPDSPSLKFDSNMLIDLETGNLVAKKPSGVDNLLKRFIAAKSQQKKSKPETVSILSTENGKLEMSEVNINIKEDSNPNKESKPGAAYFKLKENLRSIINKKRREEFEKKKMEKREEELEHEKLFDDEEEEETEYDSNTKARKKTKALDNIMIDDEENALLNIEETEKDDFYLNDNDENQFIEDAVSKINNVEEVSNMDEETDEEDSDDDDDSDEDDSGDDDDDERKQNDNEKDEDNGDDDKENQDDISKTVDGCKRKTRIIKAFQEDSEDEIDFLRTPKPSKTNACTLFDEDNTVTNPTEEDNNLLELCSGKFDATQKTTVPSIISQIPITQANTCPDTANDELLELCSGTFEEPLSETAAQILTTPAIGFSHSTNKIVSSDEETLPIDKSDAPKRLKKLSKRAKKHKVKLGFSDDEDDEEELTENEEKSNDEDIEEVPETFIDYDSEENEIVVQMTKEERLLKAEKFFEKEADLSESEWGSADEDERNLNNYDIELGDEDEFDRGKLQAELGQIHARKMLDEDIREVRKLQEMFFEDEENDGVGRLRQFKWKNTESGFSLDDYNGDKDPNGAENGESGDEENEQLWRKVRYEREQLLKEQGIKEDISVTTVINSTLSSTIVGNSTLAQSCVKKLNIITAKKSTHIETKKSSPFLISKQSMTPSNQKNVRGSFLIRDKETLNKLAGLTKGGATDTHGTAGTVSVKVVKPQNFVFATLTEEEHASLKRKSDDLLNSSTENGINFMKKPKVEPRKDKCFIDQLL